MGDRPIILFDGICNLCNGAVVFFLKRDAKKLFLFSSIQSGAGQSLMKKIGLPVDIVETMVLVEGDRYFTRSTAALRIARQLNGLWPMLYVFFIIPTPLRDAVYNFVARHRYQWFGKRDSCMIPTDDLRNRFLE